jgi:hypothetical protein
MWALAVTLITANGSYEMGPYEPSDTEQECITHAQERIAYIRGSTLPEMYSDRFYHAPKDDASRIEWSCEPIQDGGPDIRVGRHGVPH